MTLFEYIAEFKNIKQVIHITQSKNRTSAYIDYREIWNTGREFEFEAEETNIVCRIIDNHFVEKINNSFMLDLIKEHEADESEYITCLDKGLVKSLFEIQVIFDKGTVNYIASARRPYYRARGKQITPKQALQIEKQIDNWHFKYLSNHLGNINTSAFTSTKNPLYYEIIADIVNIKIAIPELDCVIAISDWDEIPDYAWELWPHGNWEEEHFGEYPDFIEHIDFGIWVHGKTIEFMEPSRARLKYQEYVDRYGS